MRNKFYLLLHAALFTLALMWANTADGLPKPNTNLAFKLTQNISVVQP
ncbi:MAG: hypothetical protein KME54_22070 [Tolypothrix brevis GSE-NOS-MK-07-07A]|nr:hypothetical protein [Tolypothrix brevis GSE-NOS-MK-07-07A]